MRPGLARRGHKPEGFDWTVPEVQERKEHGRFFPRWLCTLVCAILLVAAGAGAAGVFFSAKGQTWLQSKPIGFITGKFLTAAKQDLNASRIELPPLPPLPPATPPQQSDPFDSLQEPSSHSTDDDNDNADADEESRSAVEEPHDPLYPRDDAKTLLKKHQIADRKRPKSDLMDVDEAGVTLAAGGGPAGKRKKLPRKSWLEKGRRRKGLGGTANRVGDSEKEGEGGEEDVRDSQKVVQPGRKKAVTSAKKKRKRAGVLTAGSRRSDEAEEDDVAEEGSDKGGSLEDALNELESRSATGLKAGPRRAKKSGRATRRKKKGRLGGGRRSR